MVVHRPTNKQNHPYSMTSTIFPSATSLKGPTSSKLTTLTMTFTCFISALNPFTNCSADSVFATFSSPLNLSTSLVSEVNCTSKVVNFSWVFFFYVFKLAKHYNIQQRDSWCQWSTNWVSCNAPYSKGRCCYQLINLLFLSNKPNPFTLGWGHTLLCGLLCIIQRGKHKWHIMSIYK